MRLAFCVIDDNFNRLDKYISKTINLGRRKVNYLFNEGRVFRNRSKAKKSDKVSVKDLIEIEIDENNFDYKELKIIRETDDFLIVYKPSRFHSQEIFKNKKSVENFLKRKYNDNIKLLNRLDFYSQGLLIASKNDSFYFKYKELEENKKIEKFYLTFVKGRLFSKIIIKNNIDYKKRKVVKVLDEESDIIITYIIPLAVYQNFSVLIAKIYKGARHQIRAHLAYKGFPLVGDFIYGEEKNLDYFLYCYGYKCKELDLEIFYFKNLIKSANNYLKLIID